MLLYTAKCSMFILNFSRTVHIPSFLFRLWPMSTMFTQHNTDKKKRIFEIFVFGMVDFFHFFCSRWMFLIFTNPIFYWLNFTHNNHSSSVNPSFKDLHLSKHSTYFYRLSSQYHFFTNTQTHTHTHKYIQMEYFALLIQIFFLIFFLFVLGQIAKCANKYTKNLLCRLKPNCIWAQKY